jgi:ATP/maltotriose-dependent transcriptional regulator MalT
MHRKNLLIICLQANLFLIALDHDNNWFRYHHLFQELLITQLTRRFSREEIKYHAP